MENEVKQHIFCQIFDFMDLRVSKICQLICKRKKFKPEISNTEFKMYPSQRYKNTDIDIERSENIFTITNVAGNNLKPPKPAKLICVKPI